MDTHFKSPPRAGTFARSSSGYKDRGHNADHSNHTRSTMVDDMDPLQSISTYQDYPSTQPFINDDYRRPKDKPIYSYPESNRQAVMSALKGLQDKIRNLELERTNAEDNLKSLATETTRYQDILQQGNSSHSPPHTTVSQSTQGNGLNLNHTPFPSTVPQPQSRPKPTTNPISDTSKELESHLQAAENRSNLLEKQLEYMRRMVQSAETDRTEAIRRAQLLEAQRAKQSNYGLMSKQQDSKLSELEREHLKLTASQSLAANKIKELEEKLKEERHYRKILQERSAQNETEKETRRILAMANASKAPKAVSKKVKNKVISQKARGHMSNKVADGMDHYRLNLADMPFVAGKSTGPSHSVPANVQQVLSIMKTHNPKLCPCSPRREVSNGYHQTRKSSSSSASSYGNNANFGELLLQLQDEFGAMSYEHQELSEQIHEATDPRLRDDLERELDHLVARMETKGDQIAVLRRYQEKLEKKRRRAKAKANRPSTARAKLQSDANGEVEVRTTIRTKSGSPTVESYARPTVSSAGKASLKFLQDLKKIQTTLRKDDLSWDC